VPSATYSIPDNRAERKEASLLPTHKGMGFPRRITLMKTFPCVDSCFHCKREYVRLSLRNIYCSVLCLLAKQAELDRSHDAAGAKGVEAKRKKAAAVR
jgi:hypothetical protein